MAAFNNLFYYVDSAVAGGIIHPYIVADDSVYTVCEDDKKALGDFENSKWYKRALEADGDTVYVNTYNDMAPSDVDIIIAKKSWDNNVVAFGVNLKGQYEYIKSEDMPEGSRYFLCDTDGTVLYYKSCDNDIISDGPVYIQDIYPQTIQDQIHLGENRFYTGTDGKKAGLYCKVLSNNMYSVLSIPKEYIMKNWMGTLRIYIIIYLLIYLVLTVTFIHEKKGREKLKRVDETLQIVADSYYALYRVDLNNGTYSMIKGSDYMRQHLGDHGKYSDAISAFKYVISDDMYDDFKATMSMDNIKKQLNNKIRYFGKDFQRWVDGRKLWFEVRLLASPQISKNVVVLYFRMIEKEKRARLQQQEILKEAIKTSQAGIKAQQQFFSNMSHDMRTPLNVIIGMSDLAKEHINDKEKAGEYIEKIKFSGNQLLLLINDILDVAQLANGAHLNNENFNMRDNFLNYMEIFEVAAKKDNKSFNVTCNITHDKLYGDFRRLNEILQNLVSNAVKYTNPGDSISVSITELESDTYLNYKIEVEDTGIGMSPEFVDKIFIEYERERRYGDQIMGGTGLGMPIVKNIVELMNGKISVESRLDVGSKFTVILPFKEAEGKVDKDKPVSVEEKYTLKDKKILVAEDYKLNMELITELLEDKGAVVTKAWNGQEAVERFSESQPYYYDAVIMDMQMPVMDGCQAVRMIRKLARDDAVRIPVIAVTANAAPEDIQRVKHAGMNDYISKPVNIDRLNYILGKMIHEYKKG